MFHSSLTNNIYILCLERIKKNHLEETIHAFSPGGDELQPHLEKQKYHQNFFPLAS